MSCRPQKKKEKKKERKKETSLAKGTLTFQTLLQGKEPPRGR